jgi:hypothetical protein
MPPIVNLAEIASPRGASDLGGPLTRPRAKGATFARCACCASLKAALLRALKAALLRALKAESYEPPFPLQWEPLSSGARARLGTAH